jgi:hypothetical protein
MNTRSQRQTLSEVIKIIREKLSEAKDYLREMEKKKSVPRTFRRRLSAYLSAADSVTEIMERQGMRYARQKEKGMVFASWFAGKQNLFRTPQESNPKKGRNQGTDDDWVYLRSARHETIHVQQINLSVQHEFQLNVHLIVREDKSVCFEVMQSDGTIQQFEFDKGQPLPPLHMQLLRISNKAIPVTTKQSNETIEKIEQIQSQELPMLKAIDTGKREWKFMPLEITNGGKVIAVLQPPSNDVMTVCRNHIQTLENLIEECKAVLK